MMFRPMPLLTVLSLISLIILIMLGNWQYARYSEKISAPADAQASALIQELVINVDRSHPGNVQQVYGVADGEPIWRRYVPGRVTGSEQAVLAVMDATGGPSPVPLAVSEAPQQLFFSGILIDKSAERGAFGAKDQPEDDIWYRLDAGKVGEKLGMESVPLVAEPLILTVRNSEALDQSRTTRNPYAADKPIDPLPPERHFGYALTWWGMAIGLLGVYFALHHARGRLKFRKA